MKRNMVFGTLLLSVVLTSQAFSFDLLNGLLGKKCGCCEPACCEKAECCEPAACCEKECCEPACCDPCCKPKCDLFAGLKGLFKCKKSCGGCCEPAACCEKACAPTACCEKECCEPAGCCDDACCGETCCKPCCTPILDFLDDLCRTRIKIKLYKKAKCYGCCDTGCCEPACCGEAGCSDCNGSVVPASAPVNGGDVAPVPEPPTNAKILRTRSYYQVSRQVVRN